MPNEIKIAPMQKLIIRSGAERVSKEGAIALGILLEELGLKISKEAIVYALHSGRKTIKVRDIEIATRKILERAQNHSSRKAVDYDRMRTVVEDYLAGVEESRKKELETTILDSGPLMEDVLTEFYEHADAENKSLIGSLRKQIQTVYRRIRYILSF